MNHKLTHPFRRWRRLAGLLALCAGLAEGTHAAELNGIGISVGSLGNPFFVTIAKGAEDAARKINPNVKVITVASDYDLNKQFNQIDNFIAAGVNMILVNAADPVAIEPALKKAEAAGITVVAVDVAARGAQATVMTDNVMAGREACQALVQHMHGKGDVVIVNGPQVSAVIDRVKGCKEELAKSPDIHILSDNQDGKGSRDGGFAVMQGLLTRFSHIDGVFAINDPEAIGCSLAAKQLGRSEFVITSVDGAPDIEAALKDPSSLIIGSASQDPYVMAQKAVQAGWRIMQGEKLDNPVELMTPKFITPENVAEYKGWTSPR
jgi:ribose transport system substrate-binding protein